MVLDFLASRSMLALMSGVTRQMIVAALVSDFVGFIGVLLIRSRQQFAIAASITQLVAAMSTTVVLQTRAVI